MLIPVFEREGEPHFLLTQRTENVGTHKGQISFPGGMRNPDESLEQAALRETHEEVGIEPSQIALLGSFHEYISVTDLLVKPFCGYLQYPFETRPDEREVAGILHVPFSFFLDPGRLRVEKWIRRGREMEVPFYSYGQYVIWGLTARIILDFLEELAEEPPAREHK